MAAAAAGTDCALPLLQCTSRCNAGDWNIPSCACYGRNARAAIHEVECGSARGLRLVDCGITAKGIDALQLEPLLYAPVLVLMKIKCACEPKHYKAVMITIKSSS